MVQPYCEELATSNDLEVIEQLKSLKVKFDSDAFKIYTKEKLSITQIVELLSDFGVEVEDQRSYSVEGVKVYQFFITPSKELEVSKELIEEIVQKALLSKAPKRCKLYRFVLLEDFNLEKVIFLRAFIKYLDQLLLQKREDSIIKTFLTYHHLVALITSLFFKTYSKKSEHLQKIKEAFKNVKSYDEDRLLRIFFYAVENIERTNFFGGKETKSFKFNISAFKHLLFDLEPNIEMFVYHNEFLGVHLRASKISRGGIRWSDREDFREEIKSLMITQEAKNAIIVPSGAKGGFYIEKDNLSKEEFKHYYTLYIDALLDLVDNDPSPSKDFYFVVAADKGTADMSDVANEISLKRGYWLGDAFASGGSNGYNHKKLGVTAKGAWISAARHFVERGIDIFKDPITVVGTGSMRGDVFGNGMLINPNISLLGAISSHEIFIDPNPDPQTAYLERKRLFEEQKSWKDYNPTLISKGGGVFPREAKEIKLSPEIKRMLGIKKDVISGEELAKKLLCAKVDLLYIGGIGTYVKSSEELNISIADKDNEGVRADASDLRAYAVCEGGNLGFTQKARIEYAKLGGKINLDSIDNSAGVHTSDYEVNLKIALNQAIKEKKIDTQTKNQTLEQLTQEVLDKVFSTNYAQSLIITLDEIRSKENLELFIKSIELLEHHLEYFKRKDYSIPKNKEITTILSPSGAIVRPILGILLSYAKIFLKQVVLNSSLMEEPFLEHYLYKYFPKRFITSFENELLTHPLRKEIIATTVANIVIDNAGVGFIADFEELGEERFILKVRSYLLLYTLLGIAKEKRKIKDYNELLKIEDSMRFALQWILRNSKEINTEPFHILNYKKEVMEFRKSFKLNDLIRFIMLAILLKELKDYKLKEVLELLQKIIDLFYIDELLHLIYSFTPKDSVGRELKTQLSALVELFVTTMAKEVVFFTRSQESLLEGLESYLKEKRIDPLVYKEKLQELKKHPSDLPSLTALVHKLLLEAV